VLRHAQRTSSTLDSQALLSYGREEFFEELQLFSETISNRQAQPASLDTNKTERTLCASQAGHTNSRMIIYSSFFASGR
jgi:hypothetical protein